MAWMNGAILGPYHYHHHHHQVKDIIQEEEEEEDAPTIKSLPLLHHPALVGLFSPSLPSIPRARPRGGLNKRTLSRHSTKGDDDIDVDTLNDDGLLYELGDHDLVDGVCTNDNPSEKRRRLTVEQVDFLETSFNNDLKLEPDRKVEIAKQLGIRPRQVAIWFQNRRARWKNKQLEQDYNVLKADYEALMKDKEIEAKEHDAVVEENARLHAEVSRLKSLLDQRETNITFDHAFRVKKEEEISGKSELTSYSPTKCSSSEDQNDDSGQSNECHQASLDEEEELNPLIKLDEEEEGDGLHLLHGDDILLFHQIVNANANYSLTCPNEEAYLMFSTREDQLGGFASWHG